MVSCSTLLLVLCSFSGHTLNMELAGLEGDLSWKLLSKYAVVVDLVGTFVAWVQICKRVLCKVLEVGEALSARSRN